MKNRYEYELHDTIWYDMIEMFVCISITWYIVNYVQYFFRIYGTSLMWSNPTSNFCCTAFPHNFNSNNKGSKKIKRRWIFLINIWLSYAFVYRVGKTDERKNSVSILGLPEGLTTVGLLRMSHHWSLFDIALASEGFSTTQFESFPAH